MKTTLRSRIGSLAAAAAALIAASAASGASWQLNEQVWSRVVEHEDGTKTESKQDINTKTLEEKTFDRHEILVKRRLFRLDNLARPRSGLLFDGKDNLLARIEYIYDEYDELKEERLFNKRGRILRRLIYGLNSGGIKSKPVAFNYNPNAPKAKPVKSNDVDPIMPLGAVGPSGSGIPTQRGGSTSRATTTGGRSGGGKTSRSSSRRTTPRSSLRRR